MSDREIRHHDLPERQISDRARMLVAEADVTDRAQRFHQRLSTVAKKSERRTRRLRIALVAAGITTALIGAAIGAALSGGSGAAIGAAVPLVVWLGQSVMARAARKRGAEGFDWRTGRHVLMSNPSREVKDWDAPKNRH